ncbi:hypothetical protein [Streptomyces nodosus]|uniref:hypothetical protein n=1 Tax=Streptomyces nodosus TaxID=40318 RepID=UPI0016191FA4|nr:hypothetical protein [Streptomyces nodosus]
MALIEAMTRDDLTGPEFTDRYTEALHTVIDAKQEDRQLPQAPEPTARPGHLVDLMAALQESVRRPSTSGAGAQVRRPKRALRSPGGCWARSVRQVGQWRPSSGGTASLKYSPGGPVTG